MEIKLKGRSLVKGLAEGEALVTNQPLSFLGGVDPRTGIVTEKNHELEGAQVTNKILVFPYGKGSTVGSYTLYAMARRGTKPCGIINTRSETIIATGCVIAEIPLMDTLQQDPVETILNGDMVTMNATEGLVTIKRYCKSIG
jgi:predicted aconitase with swiveling domain